MSRSRNTVVLMASRLLTALVTLGGGIIITRSLSKSDFASYSQIMLVGSTISIITGVGLQQSLYYFVPQANDREKKTVVSRTLFLGILSIIIVVSLLFVFRYRLSSVLNNDQLLNLGVGMVLYAFFFTMSQFMEPILICFDDVRKLAIIRITTSLLVFTSILVPIILRLDVHTIIICIAISLCIPYFITLLYTFMLTGGAKFISIFEWSEIKNLYIYALPLTLSSVISIVGRRLDQYMISIMFEPDVFAVYTRGAMDIPLVTIVTSSVFAILIPEFVKLSKEGKNSTILKLWSQAAARNALLFFPLSCFFIIMAKPFMVFLYSEEYAKSAVIFRVYSISLIFQIALYGSIPRAKGRSDIIYKFAVIVAASNLVLSYPLIKFIGPIGAALGTVFSSGFTCVCYMLSVNSKLLDCKFHQIFPWYKLLQICIVTVLASVVLVCVLGFDLSPFLKLSIGFSSYSTILIFLYFKWNIAEEDDKRFLIKKLKGFLRLKTI